MVVVNQELIEAFNELAINNRIDPFFDADIEQYFEDDQQFSLNIKRSKSKVSLYSSKHVEIRQKFFNNCSEEIQKSVFKKKVTSAGISNWLLDELQIQFADIKSVEDVGKGRTIYKIGLNDNRAFVVKEKTNDLQQQFNQLANAFNIPASRSSFVKVGATFWEVSPFLNEEEVFHYKKDHLFDLYPKTAAFGDFIGLGDRHFENYITRKDQLIAIDVSHLMEPENEHWTKMYISGGLYECCLLQYYMSDQKQFEHYLERFFMEYSKTAHKLLNLMDQIPESSELSSALSYLRSKWKSETQFIQHMQHIYFQSLGVMLDRIPYKTVLQQLVENKVDLNSYPELRMYQLADADRISTFFRIEEESASIFDSIEQLALDHLGVTKQYFTDYKSTMKKIKESMNSGRDSLIFV